VTTTVTTTTTTVVESESIETERQHKKIAIKTSLNPTLIENEIVSPNGGEKINHLKKIKSVPNIDEVYVYANEDVASVASVVSENNNLKEQSVIVEEPVEEESAQKIDYLIYDVISGRAFSNDNKIIA